MKTLLARSKKAASFGLASRKASSAAAVLPDSAGSPQLDLP
jgi:hypothetical protein